MTVAIAPQIKHLVVSLEYNQDVDNPMDSRYRDFTSTLVTFHDRAYHRVFSDRDRDDFFSWSEKRGQYVPNTLELFWKIRKGHAYTVSEYGGNGPSYYKVNDKGDMDGQRGFIHYDGDIIKDWGNAPDYDYGKGFQSELDEYAEWAQGNCFFYSIEDADTGEVIDSCGGFIGTDYFKEEMQRVLEGYAPAAVKLKGDGAWIMEGECPEGITEVKEFDPADDEDETEDAYYL